MENRDTVCNILFHCASFLSIVTIAVACTLWVIDVQKNRNGQIDSDSNSKEKIIRERIAKKEEVIQQVSAAAVDFMAANQYIKIGCEYGKPVSSQQELLRFNKQINYERTFLANAFTVNQAFFDANEKLITFAGNIKNGCDLKSPSEQEWLSFIYKINEIGGQSIMDDLKKIEKLHSE